MTIACVVLAEFQDSLNNPMNQLSQQKMLIEKLSSDQEKVSAQESGSTCFPMF